MRFPLALLAIVLILPACQAASSGVSDMQVESIKADGSNALSGALLALHSESRKQTGAGGPLGWFEGEAGRLTAITDHEERQINVGAIGVTPQQLWHEMATFEDARFSSQFSRPYAYVFVLPRGQEPLHFDLRAGQANVNAASPAVVRPETWAQSERPPLDAQTGEGVKITTDASSAALSIQGDFWLVLWDWNVTVDTQAGQRTLSSGETSTPAAPSAAGVRGVEHIEERQLYLAIEDGRIDFDLQLANQITAYAQAVDLETRGSLSMTNAVGVLATSQGARRIAEPSLVLEGDLASRLEKSRIGTIAATTTGSGLARWQDGTVALATATPENDSRLQWGLLGAALLALAAYVRRRNFPSRHYAMLLAGGLRSRLPTPENGRMRRAAGSWHLAKAALSQGHKRRAVYWSRKARRLGRAPVYTLGHAEALLARNKWGRLRALLEQSMPSIKEPDDVATAAAWLHTACKNLGDEAAARHWLETAARANPRILLRELGQTPQSGYA